MGKTLRCSFYFMVVFFLCVSSESNATPIEIFSTDFNSGLPPEFSGAGNVVSVEGYDPAVPGFSGEFLRNDTGGLGSGGQGVPGDPTVLSLAGLPPHDSVSIDFLLAIVDSWDGNNQTFGPDVFNVTVDGSAIFSETFSAFSQSGQSAPTTNTLFFGANLGFNTSWPESAYDMGQLPAFNDIPHTADTLTIEWFANGGGWQGGSDESFAIENVVVSVDARAVPEPTSVALIGFGLLGLGYVRRRVRFNRLSCCRR